MKVGAVGAWVFPTGYAEAAREHLKALDATGVDVGAILYQVPHPLLHHELIRNDHRTNQLIERGSEKGFDPDVWVLHITPDTYNNMGKPTIGYAVWELIGLPTGWADRINTTCTGLMTASEFSRQRFLEGGVKVPIWVVPHPIDIERFNPLAKPVAPLTELRDKYKTIFYLNAQWMPRKGVEDVLLAYMTEFTQEDQTVLVAQVWRNSHAPSEQREVQDAIGRIRMGLNMPNQPDVMLIGGRLDRGDMGGVYAGIDVHVSASRGEAFGLPVFEAAAAGKPTIATDFGGMWDFLDDTSAYPVEYDIEPAHGVGGSWRHYNGRQMWARAKIRSLREQMRYVYEDPEEAHRRGMKAYEVVVERFTHLQVGQQMKEILEAVVASPVGV